MKLNATVRLKNMINDTEKLFQEGSDKYSSHMISAFLVLVTIGLLFAALVRSSAQLGACAAITGISSIYCLRLLAKSNLAGTTLTDRLSIGFFSLGGLLVFCGLMVVIFGYAKGHEMPRLSGIEMMAEGIGVFALGVPLKLAVWLKVESQRQKLINKKPNKALNPTKKSGADFFEG